MSAIAFRDRIAFAFSPKLPRNREVKLVDYSTPPRPLVQVEFSFKFYFYDRCVGMQYVLGDVYPQVSGNLIKAAYFPA